MAFACSVPRKGTGADIQSVSKVVGFYTECNPIETNIVPEKERIEQDTVHFNTN